jgi:hypothetical protein
MRGQKSVPPKKNLASLRVGSLHANKEGKLFKVVRLASNKKVWRVGRAKPKPKPKKTQNKPKSKPGLKRRALKGGDAIDTAKDKHMQKYHHMLRHWFCQIARMKTNANNKVCLQFFQTFKKLYGDQDCFAGQDPFNKTLLLQFITYLETNAQLQGNLGCSRCLGLLRSKEFAKYIRQTKDKDVLKTLVAAKKQTQNLVESDPEFHDIEYSEFQHNHEDFN